MTLLTAEALDFADSHAFDAEFAQGVLHFFKFEWFDDGFNFLHIFLMMVYRLHRSGPRLVLQSVIRRELRTEPSFFPAWLQSANGL